MRPPDEPVTSLALTDLEDVLVVVLGSRVILWEPAKDARHNPLFLLDGWPAVRLNDARCDPRGSLWMGSMRNNVNADGSASEAGGQDGILVRVDPDGKATTWRKGVGPALRPHSSYSGRLHGRGQLIQTHPSTATAVPLL